MESDETKAERAGLKALDNAAGLDARITAEEAAAGVPIGRMTAGVSARRAKAVGDASAIEGAPSEHGVDRFSLIKRAAARIRSDIPERSR